MIISKKKIYFRADASSQIGYGHFVRSLALADILKNDFDCTFFTQTPTEYQVSEVLKVCKLVKLPSDEYKFQQFLDYLTGDEIVVLDNYFFDTEYQRKIKSKGCSLVCLGGTDKHYVADIVISQATTDKTLFSAELYTKFCLGLNWALLRMPFYKVNATREIPKQINSAVICFGGTDYYNLSGKTIEALCKNGNFKRIDVIVGDVYAGVIDNRFSDIVNIKRNLSASEIIDVFLRNDIAILSSSGICIEAMSCKIPIISGWYVDNQDAFYNILNKNNYVYGLGNLLENDFEVKIKEAIDKINTCDLQNPFDNLSKIPENYINIFKTL